MKDWLGNELNIGDYIIFIDNNSGEFRWAKMVDTRLEMEYNHPVQQVGIRSVITYYNCIKITKRTGWTFPARCIKMDPPPTIKEAFDTI